jgi:CPA2 family monovalent cation:H+ antiporter-2/glutathione-regulated potassium-efflux system protein KefB
MLSILVALLAASVLFVSVSRRLGFGSVLGYLVAGVAIGPSGLGVVRDIAQINTVSQFGIVMLMFLIGLELRPQRLWVMRRSVFGLGIGQLLGTAVILAGLLALVGTPWRASVVLGLGLALSSTAIVLPILAERDLLGGRAGRDTFAVLLFQDLAFIPMIALIPLISGGHVQQVPWADVLSAVGVIAVILVAGRYLLPELFRIIGGARTPEVFFATALLIVVGTAAMADAVGLSMSLGAFLAGVLLSSSAYRHELQADIEPFEGLLLGFFFMSVGITARLDLVASAPGAIAAGVVGLLAVKISAAYAIAWLSGVNAPDGLRFALALPQGSEFSFVLFAAALGVGALSPALAEQATLVIALSMMATPLIFALSERFALPRLSARHDVQYDTIEGPAAPIIICGFGRMGQVVGRILRMQGIAYTALEQDPVQVEVLRRFGAKVFYGDPSRPDLLRAAGAENARLLVVVLDNMEKALDVVDIARRNFPNLTIISRARNRRHAHLLMDRNITGIVRETYYSSLRLAELVMDAYGVPPEDASRAVKLFDEHDQQALVDSLAFYEDERQLIQNSQQVAEELAGLFEADRPGSRSS